MRTLIFLILLSTLSCKKAELSLSENLQNGTWYAIQINEKKVTKTFSYSTRDTIYTYSDSTYLTRECVQKAYFKFSSNGLFTINAPCYDVEQNQKFEGKWAVYGNNTIYALAFIPMDRATGNNGIYVGFQNSKIVSFNHKQFKLARTEQYYYYSTTSSKITTTNYTTTYNKR